MLERAIVKEGYLFIEGWPAYLGCTCTSKTPVARGSSLSWQLGICRYTPGSQAFTKTEKQSRLTYINLL
jgi:hypothetical protein